ncbi:MAG: ATP-binding protein [Erysipelotrichaceae bacterium]|nr:ATP-binding protein [Erysipelotrichaceae bacterium]
MKKLLLVTSPPACGKTFVSKQLSKALKNIVYLDKDTLIPLSHQIFKAANEEPNRSSQFFEDWIRNPEYDVIVDLALEALDYAEIVLINAPFTREIRNQEWMDNMMAKLKEKDAKLYIIWVDTDIEVCRQRMIERNSDRDTWKLANWDEYIASRDYSIPNLFPDPNCNGELIIFHNSSTEEYEASLKEVSAYLLDK